MKIKFTLLCLSVLSFTALFSGCMRDLVDASDRQIEKPAQSSEKFSRTRSMDNVITDSLVIMSQQQSDLDNFMMGRVIFNAAQYELAIKRDDALFFGVSNELYDEYLLYVDKLNATLGQ